MNKISVLSKKEGEERLSEYKVVRNVGGYVIHCLDEFGDFSHTIGLLFHDEDEAEVFADILSSETREAFRNGQISTI